MKTLILFSCLFFCSVQCCIAQRCNPDSSFGTNGIASTGFGFSYDYNYASYGQQVLTQPNGSIFVVLDIRGTGETRIAKRLSTGYPDVSYGIDGFSSPVNIRDAKATIQPDGKIVVMGSLINANITDFAVARFNIDGTVDSSFGTAGLQTTDFGYGNNFATDLAIQNDGKIIVTGTAYRGDSWDVALARYNIDGTPDNSFGENGLETTNLLNGQAQSLAIQTDGKILVAGYLFNGTNNDFLLVRYNMDGNLDTSFNGDGVQTTDFNSSDDIANSVSLQTNGKIVVAGYNYKCGDTCSNLDFAIVRYNTDGSLDNSFDSDGKQTTNFNSFDDIAKSIVIQTDGKILIGGYSYNGSNQDFALCRYTINGSLDILFSGDGKQITEFGNNEFGNSMALQSNGKILIAGWDDGADFNLACYNSNGNLDLTFKGKGKFADRMSFPSQGYTFYTSTALQSDGKIITAGYTWNGKNFDFALARYNLNGMLDNLFSGDGRQTISFDSLNSYASGVAVQSDGKIVAVGNSNGDFAIARFNTDGSADNTFNFIGKAATDFGADDNATSIAIQNDGKIVVAGYSTTCGIDGCSSDFAVTRYNSNGSLDNTFGKRILDFGSVGFATDDFANSIAIQSDGKIVAAGYSNHISPGGSIVNFVIARFNTDGTPDTSFSGDGKQTTDFGGFSHANSVAIQGDGKVIAAGYSNTITNNDFAIARYNPDGSPDNSFNGNGQQITDFDFDANANSIAIQSDGKIILGGQSNTSNGSDFALARYEINGRLDNTFNGNGKETISISPENDAINAMALSGNKLYAVGFAQYPGNLGVVASYNLDPLALPVGDTISLCANQSGLLTSNISGTSYQWQINNGSGFMDINDNSNFSGSNTMQLQLNNIPTLWYGYQFRCIANGLKSEVVILKFVSTWSGNISTSWENANNWDCLKVPDANTDVIINTKTVILNSNGFCRSIRLNAGANFTINSGAKLTVTH
jgi:uncharacterized delta-60 repeat protein